MVVPLRSDALRKNPEPVKSVLQKHPDIIQASAAGLLPAGPMGSSMFRVNQSAGLQMDILWIDYDFIKTLGVNLVAGRDFSRAFAGDQNESFILNETAIRYAGYKDAQTAIDQPFQKVSDGKTINRGSIIGVVEDFNFKSFECVSKARRMKGIRNRELESCAKHDRTPILANIPLAKPCLLSKGALP